MIITTKLYTYIGAGLSLTIILLGGYILWQQNSITKLKGTIETEKVKYTQCISVNNNLKVTIDLQNKAVEKLQKQTEIFQQNLNTVKGQLDLAKKKTTARVNTIYQQPAPANKNEAFDQMSTFMKQETAKW